MHDLFESNEPTRLDLPDADVTFWPSFAGPDEARAWEKALLEELPWAPETLTLFGREVLSPRLVAWHGDPGARYAYSGVSHDPAPWSPTLTNIRERLEALTSHSFNSVLANLYRDGSDSMGWHSDDERELGPEPVIASVSLGAARRFRLRHKRTKASQPIELTHGSLLVMAGMTQKFWQHAVPKTARPVGARINLTFRTVYATRGP